MDSRLTALTQSRQRVYAAEATMLPASTALLLAHCDKCQLSGSSEPSYVMPRLVHCSEAKGRDSLLHMGEKKAVVGGRVRRREDEDERKDTMQCTRTESVPI